MDRVGVVMQKMHLSLTQKNVGTKTLKIFISCFFFALNKPLAIVITVVSVPKFMTMQYFTIRETKTKQKPQFFNSASTPGASFGV